MNSKYKKRSLDKKTRDIILSSTQWDMKLYEWAKGKHMAQVKSWASGQKRALRRYQYGNNVFQKAKRLQEWGRKKNTH